MAEVGPRIRKPLMQRPLREDVHAHAGEVRLGLARLLLEFDDPVVIVEGENAHPGRVRERHTPDGDSHVGTVAAVRGHERLVIHLVNVVARKHENGVARRLLDDVEVLQNGVRGASVPLRDAAAGDVRLEHPNAAVVAVEIPGPAHPDVVVERARVVLGQDDDVVDVRVDAVGEAEVDDAVLAPERHGRLCPQRRQDG